MIKPAEKPTPTIAKRSMWPQVALVGGYPPPYGGITVHLQRLVRYLQEQGVDFVLYNTLSKTCRRPHVVSVLPRFRRLLYVPWFCGFCLLNRCCLVHLHSTNFYTRVVFGLCARLGRARYVFTIHGRRISQGLHHSGPLRARLTRWLLRQMDVVVAVNPEIARECIEDVGLPAERVVHIPAFIAPEPGRAGPLPDEVKRFLREHDPLLSAVGWIGWVFRGEEVYGVDMMMRLVERLRADHPRLGLLMCLNGGDPAAIRQTMSECRRRVGRNMLITAGPLGDISPIVRASALFVRPTNTDGDAVSIREALYLGTPVVASDAVPRPEACVLFRTRDMDDFEAKVRLALADLPELQRRTRACEVPNYARRLLELYAGLLTGRGRRLFPAGQRRAGAGPLSDRGSGHIMPAPDCADDTHGGPRGG